MDDEGEEAMVQLKSDLYDKTPMLRTAYGIYSNPMKMKIKKSLLCNRCCSFPLSLLPSLALWICYVGNFAPSRL